MPLTTDQLDAVRRLLLDPLRETIRAELQLSHDRLAATLDRVLANLAEHREQTDRRLAPLEREVARQRSFRRRVMAIYGAGAVVLSLAWSLVRDRLLSWFGGAKN